MKLQINLRVTPYMLCSFPLSLCRLTSSPNTVSHSVKASKIWQGKVRSHPGFKAIPAYLKRLCYMLRSDQSNSVRKSIKKSFDGFLDKKCLYRNRAITKANIAQLHLSVVNVLMHLRRRLVQNL